LSEGISGMWQLSQHLKEQIPKRVSDKGLLDEWKVIKDKIDKGIGFEDAMASLNQDSELIDHIVSETATLRTNSGQALSERLRIILPINEP